MGRYPPGLDSLEVLRGSWLQRPPPQPGHDISAAAEHRMYRAVRHLKTIGCQASGFISDQELAKTVPAETRRHDYDEVILATGRQGGTRRAGQLRSLRARPVASHPHPGGRSPAAR